MSAFVIDAFEFCRAKERLEGEIAVADLARLCADTADSSGVIRWSLQGGINTFGYPELSLSVSGSVKLICQRCLAPYVFEIASESILVLAESEADVDGIDALVDDDAIDVIVGSRTMDILVLVEDDALLALPLSPKHDVCPNQGMHDVLTDSGKVSPFAVLKNIKQ
jgi:uncharacterized protein